MGYNAQNASSVGSFQNVINNLVSAVLHSIFTSYGFEPPESKAGHEEVEKTPQQELSADMGVIGLVVSFRHVLASFNIQS